MKKGALSRWRVGAWIVPLGLIALSLTIQACGGDDGCGDLDATTDQNSCARHALTFNCGTVDYSFDPSNNLCSASNCQVCPPNTPLPLFSPVPGQPTNTPVPRTDTCDQTQVINTPRSTPGVTPVGTPDLTSACRNFAVNRICGSPNYSFESGTGLCSVFGCGNCNFDDDVF